MKGKRFSEEQIMRILHDAEASGNVREVCRQPTIAVPTLYRWRRPFGGLEVSEAKRLRALQRENAALKRLWEHGPWITGCGRTCWENTGQPGCQAPGGSVSGAAGPRQRETRLPRLGAPPQHQTSAVRLTGPGRVETACSCALGALAARWLSAALPPVKGGTVGGNRATVRRIRKPEGLQGIQRACQRRPRGKSTTTPTRAAHPTHVWSYAFVHDETTDGRRLKCLTVLAAYTREGLAISCARSMTAAEVVQGWPRLCAQHGAPGYVKRDHGPECMAQRVTPWLQQQRVDTPFIAPGRPWQHGHHASCNGVWCDGCLKRWLLTSVHEARRLMTHWREAYNHERPPGALEGLTPQACAAPCRRQSLAHAA